jgi:protein arginine kinase activator
MNQKMCQECGKAPASVHLTRVDGASAESTHICMECAAKKGIILPAGDIFPVSENSDDGKNEIVCQGCGLTYESFCKRGKLGCSECYSAFAGPIDELLVKVHGSAVHRGKRYQQTPQKETPVYDVKLLRDEMNNAVRLEKFELAASIRDKIHSIEKACDRDCRKI